MKISTPLLLITLLCVVSACGSDSKNSNNNNSDIQSDSLTSDAPYTEQEAMEWCYDFTEAFCVKMVECTPLLAQGSYGVTETSQCRAVAIEGCNEEDNTNNDPDDPDDPDDDDCVVTQWPTESQLQGCITQIETTSCEDIEDIYDTGTCELIFNMVDCEDDHIIEEDVQEDPYINIDVEEDSEAEEDPNVNIDTTVEDPQTEVEIPDINTEGCVAAVTAMCVMADSCSEEFNRLPVIITDAIDNCDDSVSENLERLETACEGYLEQGLATSNPIAIFLNIASEETIEACVSGQNCSSEFLIAVINSFSSFLSSGDTDELETLFITLLAGCF